MGTTRWSSASSTGSASFWCRRIGSHARRSTQAVGRGQARLTAAAAEAGAGYMRSPDKAPEGRVGGVADPWDNKWDLAAPRSDRRLSSRRGDRVDQVLDATVQ
jgi:hypothetical protein